MTAYYLRSAAASGRGALRPGIVGPTTPGLVTVASRPYRPARGRVGRVNGRGGPVASEPVTQL